MRTIEHIDGWIVGRFEAFSHWSQRTFGTDSVWWERLFTVGKIAFLARDFTTHRPWMRWLDGLIIFTALLNLVFAERARKNIGSGMANVRKHLPTYRVLRTYLFAVVVLTLPAAILHIDLWLQCTSMAEYFSAVDDLPPGPSRVRQWLNSLSTQQTPVPVEN